MPADPKSRLLLGRVTGAHGIRGEVTVHAFTAEPSDIAAYGPLSDADGRPTIALKVVRVTPKGAVIARVEGVSDRNAAEALSGTELYIDRARLPATQTGEFYHADLIGLTVVTPDGRQIGQVLAIHNFGAGDLLEVRITDAGATELLPFTEAFVPDVQIAAGRIVIVLPESSDAEDAGRAGDDE